MEDSGRVWKNLDAVSSCRSTQSNETVADLKAKLVAAERGKAEAQKMLEQNLSRSRHRSSPLAPSAADLQLQISQAQQLLAFKEQEARLNAP